MNETKEEWIMKGIEKRQRHSTGGKRKKKSERIKLSV